MSNIKILIAVADGGLARALLADLRDCGYKAATAAPSLRAIESAGRTSQPDLLIISAGSDGAREGRLDLGGRSIPVVPVATGENPRNARRAGAADAHPLAYPCTKRELVMAVEQALPGSVAELYRAHFESVSDIVFTIDRNLVLASVSPSIKNILGYDPGELVGKKLPLARFVPAGKVRGLMALFQRLLLGQGIGTVILEVKTKGGASRTLEVKTSRVIATPGGPLVTGTARDITDWKKLTSSLQDSEQRYRLLTETSPDMIFVVSPAGIVEYINTVAAHAVGKPYDQVIGKSIGEFFPKQVSQRQGANIRRVFASGKPLSVENQTNMRGRTLWLDTWLVPVRDHRGAVVSVMGISRDITGRKEAERALREREAQLHFLGANMPGVLLYQMDVGANGKMRRFTYISSSVERLHEISADAALEDPGLIYRQMLEEHRRLLAAKERAAIRAAVPFNAEAMVTLPSGKVRWRQFISIPQPSPNQRLWDGIEIDITEGKRAEQALRESEAKYRAHFDQASDGIMFMSADGSRVSVNRSFARMHGYRSPAEMARLNLGDLDTPETARLAPQRLRRMLAGEVLDFEVEHYRKDGTTFFLQVSCSVIRIGEQPYFLGFHRDITERKRVEQALQLSEAQYRSTIDSMADAINVVDRTLRIVLVNQRFQSWCRELGLRTAMVGRTILQVFPFLPPAVRAEYGRVFRTGTLLVTEETNRVTGREIVTETRKIPIIEHGRVTRVITIVRDITERKRAETALRESEQINRAISGLTTDYSFIVDVDRRGAMVLRWASENLGRITGRSVKEASTPALWRRIIHPCDRAVFRAFVKKLLAGRSPGNLECRSVTTTGAERWVHIFVQPILGGDGKVASIIGAVKDISERKRVETARRESEEKYRGLVEATDTGFVIIDARGRVLDANGEYLRLSGHSALSQIRGRPVTDWTAPYDLKRNKAAVTICMRRGWVRALEIDYRHRDGTIVPIEVNATVIRTASGPQIVTLCRDISQRKQAERELRENLAKYQLLFNSINDSVWIQESGRRAPGKIIEVNPKACQRLGYTREEMLGMTIADIDAPEHATQIRQRFERIQRKGHAVFESDHLTKDGRRVSMELSVSSIRYQGRDAEFVVGRDITERKRAEHALRESEQRFRKVFEEGPVAMAMVDGSLHFLRVNAAFSKFLGYTMNEMKARTVQDITHPAHLKQDMEQSRRLLRGEMPVYRTEKRYITKSGTVVWGAVQASVVRDAQGAMLYSLVMIDDITQRKLLEQQILEVGDQVQRQIGRDLHDGISQLLTVIALRLKALQQHLALRHAAETEETATIAEMIKRTMTEVVGMSRGLSPLGLERGGIVLALKELAQNTAAAGVSCRAAVDETVRVADLAVATHLYRIAQEAVHNAVKHADAAHIDITLRRDPDALLLEIADDGRGLRPTTAKPAGMGLSLMRYRAGMIGATLELKRNRAGGTTVSCLLRSAKP